MDEAIALGLVAQARLARDHAHVPISHFKVGAAILAADGRIYGGCNVEISNMQSICAERCALVKALSEGCRQFLAIAIVADQSTPIAPCGQCRQALNDFGGGWSVIMATTRSDEIVVKTVGELLPFPFSWIKAG